VAWAAAKTELDDLFVVLGDLEEKRSRDKVSARYGLSRLYTNVHRNGSRNLAKRYPTQRMMKMETTMKMRTKKTKSSVCKNIENDLSCLNFPPYVET
jgi:hypothetical protein